MNLFDRNPDSIGTRPKQYAEATFEYYNRSARKSIRKMACVLEEWFVRYPNSGKADLRGRFRSVSENQHSSALLELVLHEALSQAAYSVELHPHVDGSAARPDFLASRTSHSFYMEATAVCEADAEVAKQRRIDQVYDTLNDLDSADFFLGIESIGGPTTAPPGRRLRSEVGAWLNSLDWQAVKTAGEEGREFPKFKWEHEGWSIVVEALPKKEDARRRSVVRPIGIRMGEPEWLSTDRSIKRAIEQKTKYGSLLLPLIVVVNVREDFCDQIDVFDALLGKEKFNFGPGGVRPAGRVPDGAWVGTGGAIHRNISAALIFYELATTTLGNLAYWFVHNPWALLPLDSAALPFPQYIPDLSTGKFHELPGISIGELLHMPKPWPPTDDGT